MEPLSFWRRDPLAPEGAKVHAAAPAAHPEI